MQPDGVCSEGVPGCVCVCGVCEGVREGVRQVIELTRLKARAQVSDFVPDFAHLKPKLKAEKAHNADRLRIGLGIGGFVYVYG